MTVRHDLGAMLKGGLLTSHTRRAVSLPHMVHTLDCLTKPSRAFWPYLPDINFISFDTATLYTVIALCQAR